MSVNINQIQQVLKTLDLAELEIRSKALDEVDKLKALFDPQSPQKFTMKEIAEAEDQCFALLDAIDKARKDLAQQATDLINHPVFNP